MRQTLQDFLKEVENKNPNQPEFLQAVSEAAENIFPFIEENKKYQNQAILERMVEAERIIIFRVAWTDDSGAIRVNRGYRVQMNSAIGPYKGGLRFHPTVNLNILKFLAFEQVLKNSLTTLALGGAKGGSDFNPKGKSDAEVMRFCQNFMTELAKHIGAQTDIPAGDIGVGNREIGYLFGQYKKLQNNFTGVLTGKEIAYGGSLIRPEATGYGTVYFVEHMLQGQNKSIKGKQVCISGSGNVAQYAAEKAIEYGAKVITLSDSSGYIHDKEGIDQEKLDYVKELKNGKRGRIKSYVEEYPHAVYHANKAPWEEKCEVALPCATENELNATAAKTLVKNGCLAIGEGANMPCTKDAVDILQEAKILYGIGKAANAGGVAVSGLEMSQNAMGVRWSAEKVNEELKKIMKEIHQACVEYGTLENGEIDYIKGANIAGFKKVADAMLAQGAV
ncbi:NADP-specific glutamate dehydrogenase [Haloflavibacter putidus]|uniref:Glutamate dehydrogenase n=1 Tax=Haloflavibacter putidus TaxID=2576776 RepID=A0A507ZUB3_9FLAO|nr:NADP-specific glutamate dehydrogenase [Haloflavibacter putidus]TQD40527.1 NADP-specific glutamate dehydrogenase [Haloflavibacter putidus]